jgi:hypothetical protein
LAAGIGDVATPELFVFTVADAAPLRLALAPLAGAVNVTATPAMGFDEPSVTFA